MNALLAQLAIVCPRCDTCNAPGAPLCQSCSAPLGALPGPAGSVTEPARMPELESTPMPAAPRPASVPVAANPGPKLKLVVVRGQVGAGSTFKLAGTSCPAGRSKGLLLFPSDPFVAPLHCTFFYRDGKLFLRDEHSPSGTFVSVSKELIQPGTFFCTGDTLLRYVGPLPAAAPAEVLHYGAPLPAGPLYVVEEMLEGLRPGRGLARTGPTMAVGQAGCEFLIADALVAPRHCELTFNPQGATLRDLGSPTGTFVRMAPGSERPLIAGDQVRIGNEVLRVEAA